MPRGISDIPDLRLAVLNGFVTKWKLPPNLILMNVFGRNAKKSPSSSIKWESQTGGRGMAPFKPPGAPSPLTSPFGIAQHEAEAAFWGEKMYFDEEFLNNLRKPGTTETYYAAQQRLADELMGMTIRNWRRKEWMFAKMFVDGSFTYSDRTGTKVSVDYDIPSTHSVTLGSTAKWGTGSAADILGDIIDGKRTISDDCGAKVDYAFCSNQVFQYLTEDSTIRALLQKNAFGDGGLFSGTKHSIVGANASVVGNLLDIPNFIVYDEVYEVRAYLTGAVTGGSTTAIPVDDPTDFEVGGTLTFYDVSAGTSETSTISAVNTEAGTVTVSAAPTASYKATEDYVAMKRRYIPDDKFVMLASKVDGKASADYFAAPYGLDRHYGVKVDRKETWDPDGIFIRVQDKGLPILRQRDSVYILDVE